MAEIKNIYTDTDLNTLLGEYMRDLRIEQCLSLRQLEALSGVSHTRIYSFEKGYQKNITINTLLPIVYALDADISRFFVNLST